VAGQSSIVCVAYCRSRLVWFVAFRRCLQTVDTRQSSIEPVLDGNAVCSRNIIMQDESHCHKQEMKITRARMVDTQTCQDSPQQTTIGGVRSLCIVRSMKAMKKSRCCCLHFSWRNITTKIISVCATRATTASLRFGNHCVNDKCQKMYQHYTCKYFTCNREKGNATTVATDCPAAFLFVLLHLSIVWEKNLCPRTNNGVETQQQQMDTMFDNFCKYAIRVKCLVVFQVTCRSRYFF